MTAPVSVAKHAEPVEEPQRPADLVAVAAQPPVGTLAKILAAPIVPIVLGWDASRACLRRLYITSRWEFITLSNSSRRLRIPKLFSSTFFCARSIDFVIMLCCSTSPSLWPILSISDAIRPDWNKRIRSSSSDTKN